MLRCLPFGLLVALLTACPPGPSDGGLSDGDASVNPGDGGGTGDRDAGQNDASGTDAAGPNDSGSADANGPSDSGSPDVVVPPFDAGQVPTYWENVDLSGTDQTLVNALHARVESTHNRIGYDPLFDEYAYLAGGQPGCEGIFDIYSTRCWQEDERCGQYNSEGDCYNREHTWPKSWWGGSGATDANSDVFAVLPSDGYVNGKRNNLPYGEVVDVDYTSTNGTLRGECVAIDSLCVEPAPNLKGDIARIYFYMAVRYEDEFACCDELATDGADIDAWQETMMRQWHTDDPVDDAERIRHERGFDVQENRNPFVDFPELVPFISDF